MIVEVPEEKLPDPLSACAPAPLKLKLAIDTTPELSIAPPGQLVVPAPAKAPPFVRVPLTTKILPPLTVSVRPAVMKRVLAVTSALLIVGSFVTPLPGMTTLSVASGTVPLVQLPGLC